MDLLGIQFIVFPEVIIWFKFLNLILNLHTCTFKNCFTTQNSKILFSIRTEKKEKVTRIFFHLSNINK